MTELDRKIRQWNHRRIDFFRFLKLQIAYFFALLFRSQSDTPNSKDILILRLDDKLGDCVASTGFLAAIKTSKPEAKLVVMAGASTAEIYKNLKFVDEVLESRKGFFSTLKLYFSLRGRSFDQVVNTSHILNPRSLFLTAALKSRKKIGFENFEYKIFTDFVKINFNADHITVRYQNLLNAMDVPSNSDLSYHINLPEKLKAEAERRLATYKAEGKKIVALNSFAGGRLRNFSEKTTREIVKQLTKDGDTVIVSLANSGDQKILKQWVSGKDWINFSDFCGLYENLAIAAASDLVVTPDTAWVHLASALKKKLVAVFRDDAGSAERNSVIWAPLGTEFKVITATPPVGEVDDINFVSAVDVASAIRSFL